MSNPIREANRHDQSIWYDSLGRGLIASGALARHVADGLSGVTTNPAIYEKAIADGREYDGALAALRSRGDLDAKAIYEQLALEDLRAAADLLRPVHDRTGGRDGYVSLEVSPLLARDAAGTEAEARRLWHALSRENAMIKVPATAEALPAIRALVADGINVNVTLLFSREMYGEVAEAWLAGLERRVERGEDVSRIASVASFFVSRVDTLVDALLARLAATAADARVRERARQLQGVAGVANAKLAYQAYRRMVAGDRWKRLASRGARPQRLLWASTGTKNPAYPELLYVESLIGEETIDTIPPKTFDAFLDHGRVRPTLEEGVKEARRAVAELACLGISLDEVAARLLEDGIRLFREPFEKLLSAIEARRPAPGVAACGALARPPSAALRERQEAG